MLAFALVSPVAGRKPAHEVERTFVEVHALGPCEAIRRRFSGQGVVPQRPVRLAAAGVLVGELGGHLVELPRVQDLQCLCQASMEQPPPRGADLVVGGLTEQVVREVVAVGDVPDDPGAPQLVDRPDDLVTR